MHAARLLRSCLSVAFDRMHARRCAALLGAVRALIAGRRLTLMELARSWPDALRVAAPLKKLDRLLGNPHLAENNGVRARNLSLSEADERGEWLDTALVAALRVVETRCCRVRAAVEGTS